MSEEEATRLLVEVERASERARAAHVEMLAAADVRAASVRAAMDAGIPRDRIAKAAGVKRTGIYKIAGDAT